MHFCKLVKSFATDDMHDVRFMAFVATDTISDRPLGQGYP